MSETKPTSFRFSDSELADLKAVMAYHGISSRKDAVAYLLRKEARMIEQQQSPRATYEDGRVTSIATTIGAIAESWSSDPSEWGMAGDTRFTHDPDNQARFALYEDEWQLYVWHDGDAPFVGDGTWEGTGVYVQWSDIEDLL